MPSSSSKKLSSKTTVTCPKSKGGIKKPKKKKLTLRMKYLGATPGKGSRTGKDGIARMRTEIHPPGGRIRDDPFTGEPSQYYEIQDGKWYALKTADMGHIHDAVIYWNTIGYKYKPKSAVIRKWMLDPKNYRLEHRSINRSKGSILGKTHTYRKPK